MAKRIVYYGKFNNYKKKELEDIQMDYLKNNKGDSIYYLLPNGQLLKKYRNYFINEMQGLLDLNIFTFDDIVDEILKYNNGIEIGNPVKNIIIRDILEELKEDGKLNYYKNSIDMEGFIDSVSDIIGEIKRSIVSPSQYLEKMPDLDKYVEMGLIYEKYEENLAENNFLDRESRYFESIKILRESNFLDNLETIIIDEFFDFRPIELEILKEFIKTDTNIYINMPFKTKRSNRAIEDSLKELESLGFKIERVEDEVQPNKFEEIGENLFTAKPGQVDIEDEIVEIHAANKELEILRVFQEIKKVNRAGYQLDKIGLVAASSDYEREIFKIAGKEKLPLNSPYKETLAEQVLTRELLKLLRVAKSNGSKLDFVNLIKSSYFQKLNLEEREKYEYLLRREEFEDLYDFQKKLKSSKTIKIELEDLERLFEIIKAYIEEIESIPKKAKIVEYNDLIIELFKEYRVFEKISNHYKSAYEDLFLRDIRSLNAIESVLEEIASTFIKNDSIYLEDYIYILEQYFEEKEILIREAKDKGIKILSTVSSRNLDLDCLFVLGLVQGVYPRLKNEGYFISDDEMDRLINIGLDSKPYSYRLDKEILNFASGLASVGEKLYLSYYSGSGGENVESLFLEETKKQVANIEDIKLINVDFQYGLKDKHENITKRRDLLRHLIRDIGEKGYIDKELYDLNEKHNPYSLEEIRSKNQGEYDRLNQITSKYTGKIEDRGLVEEIKSNLSSKYSISQLEMYANCPYMYFMSYILGIEEMERDYEEYSFMDMGSLYHEVLKDFYTIYSGKLERSIREGVSFDMEEALSSLEDLIRNNSLKYNISLEGAKGRLLYESIYLKLSRLLKGDIDRLYSYRMIPRNLEFDFGYDDEFFIEVGGKKVKIRGRIDRMDKSLYEDKYIVYDYKTGSSGISSIRDMKEARSFQLPVYSMSQDANIIAAGYQIINNGEMEIKISKKEETNILSNRSSGAISNEEWDELLELSRNHIVELVTRIESGDYEVNPKFCPSYCPYSDICRYKKTVEVD